MAAERALICQQTRYFCRKTAKITRLGCAFCPNFKALLRCLGFVSVGMEHYTLANHGRSLYLHGACKHSCFLRCLPIFSAISRYVRCKLLTTIRQLHSLSSDTRQHTSFWMQFVRSAAVVRQDSNGRCETKLQAKRSDYATRHQSTRAAFCGKNVKM